MSRQDGVQASRRVRVERGVYRQPNGKYAVCFMLDGRPRFRTVAGDLGVARSARARLAIAAQAGLLPACPRLTFATVAARWLERFETMVAVGERRVRTLESHRYVEGRALQRAAAAAGLRAVRFHDLRHTFASHVIIDLGLDVAQVSRILGHASVTTTLNIYTHLFDDARHANEIRARMASSPFARLLEPDGEQADNVVAISHRRSRGAARRRRAVERART